MRREKKEKKKQHKSLENRGKIRKDPDFCSLQRVKDRLAKQVHDRHRELHREPPESRYSEIHDGLHTPELPLPERSAAHEAFRTSYLAQFKKVVDASDAVLEVLDIRDPLGCRAPKLEGYVLQRGKRVVLVLNKVDLVPVEVANRWLTYLRRELPVVLFKSSARPGRGTEVPLHDGKWRAGDSFGVAELISLLNRYAGGASLVMGVIGPPNSGKSSLINTLSRRPAAGVAATPGFTRALQEIEVTSRIRLLDCPGVVPGAGSDITPSMVLRNAIKIELLEDPITPVAFIVDRVPKEQLVGAYGIGSFADAEDFLAQLAHCRGRLLNGGEPDVEGVARAVLSDWNKGRIRYYTLPPTGDDPVEGPTELVTPLGEVYQMGRTMDFGEGDFRTFQIQHVCEIVQRRKAATDPEAAAHHEESSGDDERVVPGDELPPEEQAELDQLAEEYKGISFGEL